MLSKNKTTLAAAVAAATTGTALAQDATPTPGTTLTTVTGTPAATTSVTSLLLGPFGGVGFIHASVVEVDESSTVYALDCDEDHPEECDISPFTVTEGDKDMHIVSSYIGAPMVADYSCTFTGLAETDTLSCYYTTTTSGEKTSEMTTEYDDPSLYFSPVTITAGLELLEEASATSTPEPTTESLDGSGDPEADGFSAEDADSSATGTAEAEESSSSTGTVTSESEDSTSTNEPVDVNAGNIVPRSGAAAVIFGALTAAFAMI
ncbi:hypothetical protein MKZ38_000348 [Zalerion maritima]|uniref:Uncharacterized protein n=1 Tax=Zalerion maritima TaxID=339359 RepID=A0AAD5RRK3_9PEZI|nr:hypothetical protein MKZ38_000348 [Zalerion maritima]